MRPIDADALIAEYDRIHVGPPGKARELIMNARTVQPKAYTKADYIMALHREYGCTLTRAKEAHDKALEYLRSKTTMKG